MLVIPTTGLKMRFDDAELRINQIRNNSRWIQIDVSDNVFLPTKTFELELIKKLKFNADDILWDVHLMVNNPINWIEKCIFIGASRIVGQVERMEDRNAFITVVKDAGLEAGLAFDVNTDISDIPDEADEILIMGRKAGVDKTSLDEKIYQKIAWAKKFEKQIGVDGGVTLDNIEKLEKAGADIVYSETNYFELINGKNQ